MATEPNPGRAVRLVLLTLRVVAVAVLGLVAIVSLWVAGNIVRAQLAESRTEAELAPRNGRWVAAGDAELFVQEWGPADGPVLVMTHGTGAWSGTWFGTPAFLAGRG